MKMQKTGKVIAYWDTHDGIYWVVDGKSNFCLEVVDKSKAFEFDSLAAARHVVHKYNWTSISYEYVKEPIFKIETPQRRIKL